jgi:hypothetical protein
MKKLALSAIVAASALAATPAFAVDGTVIISGNVASKCLVTKAGTPTPDFGGTVALGDLANTADGTLTPNLDATFNAAGTTQLDFRVVCTSANTSVSVTANPLATAAPAATGYSNRVDYTADVTFSLVSGDQTLSDSSAGAVSATSTIYGSRLATGATNVQVRSSAFNTAAAGANAVMMAGTYGGSVQINITPNP